MKIRILMILVKEGYRDEEYEVPKGVFESEGFEVVTASTELGEAKGKLGGFAHVDVCVYDVQAKDFDAVVFVGGPGAPSYWHDLRVEKLLQDFSELKKVVAAICIAPTILAYAGLLEGKRATVFNEDQDHVGENILREKGALYTRADVIVDGNFVTACGPKPAEEFALAVVGVFHESDDS